MNKFKRGYLLTCGTLGAISVPLYLISPSGTASYFGGTPSSTSDSWVRIVASGDLLLAYICYSLANKEEELQNLALRSVGIYGVFHCGSYLAAHYLDNPMNVGQVVNLGVSTLICVAAYFWGRSTKRSNKLID